ncbi:uncharacterized protein LOC129566634 [Sitodiplosis mosellana]|uniref:uncharacterized protein LOC129566634 n=1 Tax=Sitodiplosis mosellana TaxID=263140 RepID=UPI002444760D|nr:uncharacterized protein LOC129566634 [Sitodiplosis mosellana]
MKFFLCILVLSFATMQELVVADKRGPFDANMCCNAEKSEPDSAAHEALKEALGGCKKELGSEMKEGKFHIGKYACMMECISKKMNVIDANGNINETEFTDSVKKFASGDYQKAVAEDIAKKCIAGAKTAIDNGAKGDNECSFTAMKMKYCVGKEMFNACPADKQDTSDQCVELRKITNGEKPKEE